MYRRLAALALAFVGTAALAAPPANAATATDLYVDRRNPVCADGGAGTQQVPFCTIQVAADVVLPGQTVHVAAGDYAGVTITRSGTAGAPITFVGANEYQDKPGSDAFVGVTDEAFSPHAFAVSGAHDVVISTFVLQGTSGAVAVDNSSRVTIDSDLITSDGTPATSGVSLTGASSAITISRDEIRYWGTAGVSVGQGVTATITTNVIGTDFGPAVVATDAPGTVITSNTVSSNCVSGVVLAGASTGSTVENNILYSDDNTITGRPNCTPHTSSDTGEIVVAAAAAERTVVDYNLLYTTESNWLYSWGGVGYRTPADFQAASDQGAHDLNADPKFTHTATIPPTEGSPAIDSGDPSAPGELTTDILHAPRVDDLLVANTGPGIVDRGASEFQDPFQLTHLDATPIQGPAPLPVTLTAKVDNPWSTPVSYTFDFGDGSAPVISSSPVAQHTYDHAFPRQPDGPSGFTARVTATLAAGVTRSAVNFVRVVEPEPTVAKLRVRQLGPLMVGADAFDTTDPWPITEYDYDFGDGSPVVKGDSRNNYTYQAPGTYPVTLTIHDANGGTATATQQITVAGAYYADGPQRLLDTRDGGRPLGAGGQTSLQVTGANGVPATGVTAVVLNVTATDTTADSFLSLFPSGSANPGTSNLNFAAGQTVPNLVTVPVGRDGKVVIANHAGMADVVVDLEGYYRSTPAQQTGGFLKSVQPERVMDTRDGTGSVPTNPVGSNQDVYLGLGNRVPLNAAAVVLNVTVTNPTADSFLTVHPDADPTPTASDLNYRTGQTTSNLVIVPLSNTGVLAFHNHAGNADVIADIQGYFAVSADTEDGTSSFTPVSPSRMLDTRDGTGGFAGPVTSNETIGLLTAGVGSVPSYAKSVVLNVTVVNGTADSYLTVFPGVRPATSNLNFGPGQITQTQVIVPIGPDGRVDFYNHVGSVDVIADVFGYFA